MDTSSLTISHLETLSTADLLHLAEEYGIDIPEGLNRRFIIGELLEIENWSRNHLSENPTLDDGDMAPSVEPLPETYNETTITILLRDPQWVHVYWDIQSNLLSGLMNSSRFETLFLRINSLRCVNGTVTVTDWFEIDVSVRDRSWYVYLTSRECACRVDLCCRIAQEKEQVLARSYELILPTGGLGEYNPGPAKRLPPLLVLSGIEDLRREQFRIQRQPLL